MCPYSAHGSKSAGKQEPWAPLRRREIEAQVVSVTCSWSCGPGPAPGPGFQEGILLASWFASQPFLWKGARAQEQSKPQIPSKATGIPVLEPTGFFICIPLSGAREGHRRDPSRLWHQHSLKTGWGQLATHPSRKHPLLHHPSPPPPWACLRRQDFSSSLYTPPTLAESKLKSEDHRNWS